MSNIREKFRDRINTSPKNVLSRISTQEKDVEGWYTALLVDIIIQPNLESKFGVNTKLTFEFMTEIDGEEISIKESCWQGKTEKSKFFRLVNPMIEGNPIHFFDPNLVIGEVFDINVSTNHVGDKSYINIEAIKQPDVEGNNGRSQHA